MISGFFLLIVASFGINQIIMKPFFKTVLLTGLFVGVTDNCCSHFRVDTMRKLPTRVLQYIAGGALGLETSMKGGLGTALLGLLFHFFIATSWTMFFFVVIPKLKFLHFNKYRRVSLRDIRRSLHGIPYSPSQRSSRIAIRVFKGYRRMVCSGNSAGYTHCCQRVSVLQHHTEWVSCCELNPEGVKLL